MTGSSPPRRRSPYKIIHRSRGPSLSSIDEDPTTFIRIVLKKSSYISSQATSIRVSLDLFAAPNEEHETTTLFSSTQELIHLEEDYPLEMRVKGLVQSAKLSVFTLHQNQTGAPSSQQAFSEVWFADQTKKEFHPLPPDPDCEFHLMSRGLVFKIQETVLGFFAPTFYFTNENKVALPIEQRTLSQVPSSESFTLRRGDSPERREYKAFYLEL